MPHKQVPEIVRQVLFHSFGGGQTWKDCVAPDMVFASCGVKPDKTTFIKMVPFPPSPKPRTPREAISSSTEVVCVNNSRITIYEHVTQRQTLTKNIMEYLNENIDKAVTLEDISNSFSYSLSSIKRIFKEETGTSIICYLNNLRMCRAKELLMSSDLSIGDIALALGFSNIYYFSTAFKKRWGISPTRFRSKQRQ